MQNTARGTANNVAGFVELLLCVAIITTILAFFLWKSRKLCFKRRAQLHINDLNDKAEDNNYPKQHTDFFYRVGEQNTREILSLMSVVLFLKKNMLLYL